MRDNMYKYIAVTALIILLVGLCFVEPIEDFDTLGRELPLYPFRKTLNNTIAPFPISSVPLSGARVGAFMTPFRIPTSLPFVTIS